MEFKESTKVTLAWQTPEEENLSRDPSINSAVALLVLDRRLVSCAPNLGHLKSLGYSTGRHKAEQSIDFEQLIW